MSEGTICQDLHALTVAICKIEDKTIIGTGFVVSSEHGLIITCAHVIEDVCNQKRQIGLKVGVYFRNNPISQKYLVAVVVSCLPDFDDDIALLKLENGSIPLQHKLVELGTIEHFQYRNFISYGYGRTNKDPYVSAPIEGRILGPVETDKLNLCKNRVYLKTEISILDGHSGSPVLDQTLNRIVGIIIDSNGSNAGHATDCAILTLENFNSFSLPFSDIPVPKLHARTPRCGVLDTIREDFSVSIIRSFGIPEPTYEVSEWTGRKQLLEAITENWNHPTKRISTLIGFGGEGKSSLVRRWIESTPEINIFWWSFYKNSDVDAFFEASFRYISQGKYTNARKETRAEKLAAFLYTGKYLFVLDGFEVMQYNNLNNYGEVINENLQLFLEYFTSPLHDSHCIITSRIPLRFNHYTTFTQYDVDRLSVGDGCALLRNLGVQDNDAKLAAVVQAWDGHALALSLVGSYLREKHEGKITNDITISIKDIHHNEHRREQVARMLARYEISLLNETDKNFLLIFSAFRLPVNSSAISIISRYTKTDISTDRLINYKILRYDKILQEYSIHPLISDYYKNNLKEDSEKFRFAHTIAKDYYSEQIPQVLDDHLVSISKLSPVVEAIFHSCLLGEYDAAYAIYLTPIYIQSKNKSRQRGYNFSELFIHWLGAYNIAQDLLKPFFPGSDTKSSPSLQSTNSKSTIFYDLGQCSMCLGKLDEAIQQYQQAINGYEEEMEWFQAARVYRHLAVLFIQKGDLANAFKAAECALHLAEELEGIQKLLTEDNFQKADPEMYQDNPAENTIAAAALLGYIDSLRGEIDLYFAYMLDICSDITLYREAGLWYASYLERIGLKDNADYIARYYIEKEPYIAEKSQCYRIRAKVAVIGSNTQSIQEWFNKAVESGRESSRLDVLIEALIARGNWFLRQDLPKEAKEDLDEALTYSKNVYRLYEADNRIGLAWLYHLLGDQQTARKEANEAQMISKDIGYFWAGREAEELLNRIDST